MPHLSHEWRVCSSSRFGLRRQFLYPFPFIIRDCRRMIVLLAYNTERDYGVHAFE